MAVLFGPERAGLENDDIARANAIVTVPVNPDFPSLNLAQCVSADGLRMAPQRPPMPTPARPEPGRAGRDRGREAGRALRAALDEAGFFFPETKAAGMKRNLRNLWSGCR